MTIACMSLPIHQDFPLCLHVSENSPSINPNVDTTPSTELPCYFFGNLLTCGRIFLKLARLSSRKLKVCSSSHVNISSALMISPLCAMPLLFPSTFVSHPFLHHHCFWSVLMVITANYSENRSRSYPSLINFPDFLLHLSLDLGLLDRIKVNYSPKSNPFLLQSQQRWVSHALK